MLFNPYNRMQEPVSESKTVKKTVAQIQAEYEAERIAKLQAQKKELDDWCENVYNPIDKIVVTTCDISDRKYKVIRPCFYQVSNKGFFADKLSRELKDKVNSYYLKKISSETGTSSKMGVLLYGETSVNQEDFEKAFAVAIMSMKKQAYLANGDAVIGYTQDIDLDTNGPHAWFYLQCYGTIIKFLD